MKNQAFGLKAAVLCVVAAGFDLLACPMASDAAALKVQYSFTELTEASGSFSVAKNGSMFTVAGQGGTAGLGALLEYDPKSRALAVLHNFLGGTDGAQPVPGLALTKSGMIYGATAAGGSANLGTIFKFDTKSGVETVLHSFVGPDGNTPQYGPIIGADGTIYGTTAEGGTSNLGVVFRLNPNDGKETVIFNFNGNDGANPNALALSSAGLLYGTTAKGGANVYFGNLFYIDPNTGSQTVLYNFTQDRPGSPSYGLVFGKNGTIYGTASLDGFSFNPITESVSDLDLYSSGCNATGTLVADANDNLFEVCNAGKSGQVLEYSPSANSVTVLWQFYIFPNLKLRPGVQPAGLAFGKDGLLYGATQQGGATYKTNPPGFGNIYRLAP